jgi:hypothetical protein
MTEAGGLGLRGPEPAAQGPADFSNLSLPNAKNAEPLEQGEAVPVVSVVGSSISCDGVAVGDAVARCLVGEFGKLTFPRPEGGVVTVVYPIVFNPGDEPPATPPSTSSSSR